MILDTCYDVASYHDTGGFPLMPAGLRVCSAAALSYTDRCNVQQRLCLVERRPVLFDAVAVLHDAQQQHWAERAADLGDGLDSALEHDALAAVGHRELVEADLGPALALQQLQHDPFLPDDHRRRRHRHLLARKACPSARAREMREGVRECEGGRV
eukprot:1469538-Rhodomonas_salina.1